MCVVICVLDIVSMARRGQSIIPAAIFGLLWTFLLTTYVRQWYLLNTWLPLFYLPSSCCTWYYVSGTLLLWPEHARALFPWPYLDSCGPFCSQHAELYTKRRQGISCQSRDEYIVLEVSNYDQTWVYNSLEALWSHKVSCGHDRKWQHHWYV